MAGSAGLSVWRGGKYHGAYTYMAGVVDIDA